MNEMAARAHAKINLTLDVGARRVDGYHEIRSVMQTIGLHDTLTIRRTPGRAGIALEVFGDEATDIPADESNLVHRAAARLQEDAAARQVIARSESGLHIRLEKRIPSQAGLGGGSSDAAAALRAINTLLGMNLPLPSLMAMASKLGADVPFFLVGGTALVEGLGEKVKPLSPLDSPWDLVIVKPSVGISTGWAYGKLDAMPARIPGSATSGWLRGMQQLSNDFGAIARELPEIAVAWDFLHDASEREPDAPPLLCGSGSAIFCKVRDSLTARLLGERASAAGIGMVWETQTVRDTG